MNKEEIKLKIHQLIDEMDDETALQMLYDEAVEYKTSSSNVTDEELTKEQWALIEKARTEIKNGQYHTYDEVKAHFAKWLTRVIFSDEVLRNLDAVVFYLEQNWSKAIAEKFLLSFFERVNNIAIHPKLSRKSSKHSDIRKILITKHNMLYYEVHDDRIELLQIFDTRQNPGKNKFE